MKYVQIFNDVQDRQLRQLKASKVDRLEDAAAPERDELDQMIGGYLDYFDTLVNCYLKNEELARLGHKQTVIKS